MLCSQYIWIVHFVIVLIPLTVIVKGLQNQGYGGLCVCVCVWCVCVVFFCCDVVFVCVVCVCARVHGRVCSVISPSSFFCFFYQIITHRHTHTHRKALLPHSS